MKQVFSLLMAVLFVSALSAQEPTTTATQAKDAAKKEVLKAKVKKDAAVADAKANGKKMEQQACDQKDAAMKDGKHCEKMAEDKKDATVKDAKDAKDKAVKHVGDKKADMKKKAKKHIDKKKEQVKAAEQKVTDAK